MGQWEKVLVGILEWRINDSEFCFHDDDDDGNDEDNDDGDDDDDDDDEDDDGVEERAKESVRFTLFCWEIGPDVSLCTRRWLPLSVNLSIFFGASTHELENESK